MSTITYAAWAFAAGALIPLMASLNAGLARGTGGSLQATVLLFATWADGLCGARGHHEDLDAGPSDIGAHRPVIVGFYILSITFLAPRFDVGNAILFEAVRPLTTMRAVGLFIVVVGVVITQVSDRMASGGR